MLVVFVSKRAKPVAPPATQKLAASDTLNDGRPVRTVMIPLISPTHAPPEEHNGDHEPERHVEDGSADREKDRRGADNRSDRKVEFPGDHQNANGYRNDAEFSGRVEPARGSVDRDETRALRRDREEKIDENSRHDSAKFGASGHPFQRPSTAPGRVVNSLRR
jgi:hypothetical protein